MTSTTIAPPATLDRPRGPQRRQRESRWRRLSWAVSDSLVLTWRSVARIAREPETLMDVTVQPLMFVLLFTYVFGGAIAHGSTHDYLQYELPGLLVMTVVFATLGTGLMLNQDITSGVRSLPMSRAAVLLGRTTADLLTQVIGALVIAMAGLAVGWRIHTGPADALAAFGLALLFGYAFTWAGVCLGMVLRSVEAAQQLGFILFLPLMFISNAFVPTQGMPAWLRVAADWNPFSAVAAACRRLFGNPDPSALVQAWPMQHPELAVLLWSGVALVVFVPLAVRMYANKNR